MLVLFETPGGYALFKVLDEGKVKNADTIFQQFETPEKASSILKLVNFQKFKDTTEALAAASALVDGSLDDNLRKFLKKSIVKAELKDKLAVADAKLAGLIKDELNIKCINDSGVNELMRGIRNQMNTLLDSISNKDMHAMVLGLSHSLGRYKLKFSADKVDTMIIQAISLLDELDKEINIYAMRVKEWYGWHFPEMQKIVLDNIQYAKVILKMGFRKNAHDLDFSDILEENVEEEMKKTALISTGTDISDNDLKNIQELATQVLDLAAYRVQLNEYLQNRMHAVAPNLSVIVGEQVGARLIAHAGSLMNLAKFPASTVQILGAEKALFRALKTRHETPKYGLIYHASLVGQAAQKHKGKISRVLASKAALAIRVDALSDKPDSTLGEDARVKVEERLRQLEGAGFKAATGSNIARQKSVPAAPVEKTVQFNTVSDVAKMEEEPKKEEKKEEKKEKKEHKHKDKKEKEEKKKEKKEKKDKEEKKEKKEKKDKKDKEDKKDKKDKKEKKEKKEKKWLVCS